LRLKCFLTATVLGMSTGSVQAAPLITGIDVQKPYRVEVDSVKIENLAGHTQIKSGGSGRNVIVQMVGDPKVLAQILVKEEAGKLEIAFDHAAPIQKDIYSLKVIVTMPQRMPLDLTLVGGKGEIGHREADTTANIDGYGDVKSFKSEIKGSGEVTVNKIDGAADIAIRGDGKFMIQKGAISDLKAIIQGTGRMDIRASTKNADLKSDGAGEIKLAKVTGTLKEETQESGKIIIG
jgi:Putative auto-transporter adhesin, head GIN domain